MILTGLMIELVEYNIYLVDKLNAELGLNLNEAENYFLNKENRNKNGETRTMAKNTLHKTKNY